MFVKIEEGEDNGDLPKAEVSKDGVQNYFDSYGDWRESQQGETTSMNLAVRLFQFDFMCQTWLDVLWPWLVPFQGEMSDRGLRPRSCKP